MLFSSCAPAAVGDNVYRNEIDNKGDGINVSLLSTATKVSTGHKETYLRFSFPRIHIYTSTGRIDITALSEVKSMVINTNASFTRYTAPVSYLSALNSCPVLVSAPLWPCAGWLSSCGLIARICQQQCNNSMSGNFVNSEIPDGSPIVSVSPEILRKGW